MRFKLFCERTADLRRDKKALQQDLQARRKMFEHHQQDVRKREAEVSVELASLRNELRQAKQEVVAATGRHKHEVEEMEAAHAAALAALTKNQARVIEKEAQLRRVRIRM